MTGVDPAEERFADLSAHLDGELDPERAAEVEAWLAEDAEARAAYDELAEVRSLVRGLPPVDPPFGFYERMVHPPRRRRRVGRIALGAATALVAAFVLLAGLTPVADPIVPAVEAFAQRHDAMMGSEPMPPDDFVPVDPGDDEAMGGMAVPDSLGGMEPMATYASDDAVHAMYGDAEAGVSLFEQHGTVDWEAMPDDGTMMAMGDDQAWVGATAGAEVVVLERGATVYTVVFSGHHDEMMTAIEEMPPPPAPTVWDRLGATVERIADAFGFGG